ncbi:MAG: LL-diaminopimelate aminotransferase [Candidatus Coatesbacteria bacterium]|nr:LL-diaminopimelate aminotransferase [Candidatus Coatesbacteria bacterium]
MKLSSRLNKFPVYLFAEIDRKISEMRSRGIKVISFGIGDPDLPTPSGIVTELNEKASDPLNHRYPSYFGMDEFREAASRYLAKRYNVKCCSEDILALIGSKEGIAHISLAYLDSSDIVLVPSPGYPVYYTGTIIADGIPFLLPLKEENGFLPDLSSIPSDVARKAKIFFINYPNNPTGAFANENFRIEIIDFCRKNDILLCSDMAYGEVYFGKKPFSFLSESGDNNNILEFHSLSKPFNMTGWRIGFAAGDKEAIDALGKIKTNIDSGVFQAIQYAGIHALENELDMPSRFAIIYKKRMEKVREGFKYLGLDLRIPDGTFYFWSRVPEGFSSASFADFMLDKYAVVVTPGSGFGEYGEGFFRISTTLPDSDIEEATERFRKKGG